jgi:hypothetical protein
MAKFKVKLALQERDVPNKVEFGRIVVTAMTGNPDFATPNPTLVQLTTVTDDLETAYNNSEHGVLSTALLHEAEEDFDTIMTAMSNYVDSIAKGSQAVINGAGMDATTVTNIPLVMTIVLGVEGRSGALTGEIKWDWDKVKGARIYLVYLKEDVPAAEYKLVAFPTKTKIVLSGLTPGVKYFIQVRAAGASGLGPLSDASSAYAAF